ncbi:hypothetical protein [Mesorhizobium sp. M0859]|uniref:hypothetical protein n=1 Tax=Mesorhizobium sp. M0859 TaxID=2957014 RepID=UPI00333ADC01
MAKREFIIEYEFSSTSAYGDSYTRRVTVSAEHEKEALYVARIVGFERFGARFTDNCFDWRIVR